MSKIYEKCFLKVFCTLHKNYEIGGNEVFLGHFTRSVRPHRPYFQWARCLISYTNQQGQPFTHMSWPSCESQGLTTGHGCEIGHITGGYRWVGWQLGTKLVAIGPIFSRIQVGCRLIQVGQIKPFLTYAQPQFFLLGLRNIILRQTYLFFYTQTQNYF